MEEWWNPAFISDESDSQGLIRSASVQYYLGGAAAGAQPHWHAAAWNWLVRGRKEWLLWPPRDATYAQSHVARSAPGAEGVSGAPLRCEQRAGDTIVVPALWGHATVNLAPSVGWATEIRFDRTFDLGMGADRGDEWWRTRSAPKKKRAAAARDEL